MDARRNSMKPNKMSSDLKTGKTFPTILSKLKAMRDLSGSSEATKEDGGKSGRGEEASRGGRGEEASRSRPERGLDPRLTPRLAWASRKDSTFSTVSSLNNGNENPKALGLLGRIPSLMNLGGSNSAWGKRLKKKRDAEEYAALKLARQKEEMASFYRGTPMTDDKATSSEILKFLYEMWQPQLCSSYRKNAKITTTCRQDMRSARKIAQSTPRRLVKLHRARLIIETCNQMSGHNVVDSDNSSPARPRSAKSVTSI